MTPNYPNNEELLRRTIDIVAIARSKQKLMDFGLKDQQIFTAEITKPEAIKNCCEGIDIVISTVGITRQKDGLTYMDVDYQANKNLLEEALRNGVKKFIYISAINGDKFRDLKVFEAKEKFVDDLKSSGMEYSILRPNGFFSDMRNFLDMAKSVRVYLFGSGNLKLNPIHGADLAEVCVDAIDSSEKEIVIGGPDLLTQNEIASLALNAWDKPIKIMHLPDWTRRLTIVMARTITSSKTYGPIEFFMTAMSVDNIAPYYGSRHLGDFFKGEVELVRTEYS